MKITMKSLGCLFMLTGLAACGSDTVVHEHPVIVQPAATPMTTPGSVENTCAHGYDNSTHRCY